MHRLPMGLQMRNSTSASARGIHSGVHRFYLAIVVLGTACTGVTETNVTPAPCTTDEECGPAHRCEPLDDLDGAATDGDVPHFCRPR